MEMCYDGTLVMPKNYAVVNEEEMTYVEGGWSATVYGSLSQIRNRINTALVACVVGDLASLALVAGGELIAMVLGGIFGWYFTSTAIKFENAHNQCENLISRYGKNRKAKMYTTWSLVKMTGCTVSVC